MLLILAAAAACSPIPPSAYEITEPETLLDVSSEVVNLDISSTQSTQELARWIEQDQPSRAEVYCPDGNEDCHQALDVMDLYAVPYVHVPSGEFTATLVYERVLARDCENRYIDNSVNPYHLNYPSFGCAISVNMLQQVADKQQFVRPNLLDRPDARKSLQVYQNYMTRREPGSQNTAARGLVESARAN